MTQGIARLSGAFWGLVVLIVAALPARAEIDIQEIRSPGGIDAWLVESHDIPFVAIELRFRGGASLDQPDKRGAINLMTGLLEEGAGDLDAQAFARSRDALAAGITFDVGRDSLSVSARFLTENRDQAADLLRLALVEPRFDQDAIDRVRDQVISVIGSDAKDPGKIAWRSLFERAYGPDHPYGAPLNGTEESVNALTRDDLMRAKDSVLARDRLVVSAVGDITGPELGALLDRILSDLPETGAPFPPPADYQLPPGKTVVDFETPQSIAVFGHEGIARDDPDFFAAYILTEVLGSGGLNSRLTEEVREKRGLTYGVYAFLLPMDRGALMIGQVASANARIGEAMDVIRAEWVKAATDGITAQELDEAKTYLTGAYPLRFDGNGTIAGILTGMQMENLSPDYVRTRNDKVRAVTLDDIARVAARILRPDDLHFVVVGQPEGVETGH